MAQVQYRMYVPYLSEHGYKQRVHVASIHRFRMLLDGNSIPIDEGLPQLGILKAELVVDTAVQACKVAQLQAKLLAQGLPYVKITRLRKLYVLPGVCMHVIGKEMEKEKAAPAKGRVPQGKVP
eukprot:1147357-Pelagomonas_calceolata.AAC.3